MSERQKKSPGVARLLDLLERARFELRLAVDVAQAESVNLPGDVLGRLEGIRTGLKSCISRVERGEK